MERECEHKVNVPSKTTLTSMFAPHANFTISSGFTVTLVPGPPF